jgi:hypothetical protein
VRADCYSSLTINRHYTDPQSGVLSTMVTQAVLEDAFSWVPSAQSVAAVALTAQYRVVSTRLDGDAA